MTLITPLQDIFGQIRIGAYAKKIAAIAGSSPPASLSALIIEIAFCWYSAMGHTGIGLDTAARQALAADGLTEAEIETVDARLLEDFDEMDIIDPLLLQYGLPGDQVTRDCVWATIKFGAMDACRHAAQIVRDGSPASIDTEDLVGRYEPPLRELPSEIKPQERVSFAAFASEFIDRTWPFSRQASARQAIELADCSLRGGKFSLPSPEYFVVDCRKLSQRWGQFPRRVLAADMDVRLGQSRRFSPAALGLSQTIILRHLAHLEAYVDWMVAHHPEVLDNLWLWRNEAQRRTEFETARALVQ